MNTYNINDINFENSNIYQDFLKENPTTGHLKIRAYAANGAIPIKNMRIIISKNIDDNKIIFFNGMTNESGVIEKIDLPTPKLNESDLVKPNSITYDINAIYLPDDINSIYTVKLYENVFVVQNINVIPKINNMGGL